MRIVEFCVGRARSDSSNGVELSVFRLSEALARDHDVMTICLSSKPMVPIPGVRVVNLPPAGRVLPIPEDLLETLEEWEPDVVHLHSVYSPANTHLARHLRRRSIPYIVTPHGGYGETNERHHRTAKILYRAMFEREMLSGAAFVHSVGDGATVSRLNASADIVETTKGLDVPDHDPEGDRDGAEERTSRSFVFGFVGRLDPLHKGLDLLIEALATDELSDSSVVLVGPTHESGRSSLERLASLRGVTDRVVFAGERVGPDKTRAISSFDVFVHVSRWEGGIPYAVLEATAQAKPLLLTRYADPQGELNRVGAGLIVEPDVDSVRQGMIAMSSMSSERLEQMGLSGQRHVLANFGWQAMSDQLVKALREIDTEAR
jgi:glycosyltransferase involved in cell wall biosynthesis